MDNRSRLLAVALDLFAARGYDAVGVQEVAEAAGVTKPTLYHYFGNKLGMLEAIARERDAARHAVLEAARYDGDLPLAVSRVVNAYFHLARTEPAYGKLRLALWLAPGQSEAGRLVGGQLVEEARALEGLFEAASRDHGNMRGRSRLFATSLQGLVFAHTGRALAGDGELSGELAFQAAHQFMHGIYS